MGGNNFWKFVTTLIVWAAMSFISLGAMAFAEGSYNAITLLMVLIPLVIALGATMSIWDTFRRETQPQAYEKVKRTESDKYALLMQMMDDDEREAFKDSLKRRLLDEAYSSDGEIDSLDDLLNNKKLRR